MTILHDGKGTVIDVHPSKVEHLEKNGWSQKKPKQVKESKNGN